MLSNKHYNVQLYKKEEKVIIKIRKKDLGTWLNS